MLFEKWHFIKKMFEGEYTISIFIGVLNDFYENVTLKGKNNYYE